MPRHATVIVLALVLGLSGTGMPAHADALPGLARWAAVATQAETARQWVFKPARTGGTPIAVWVMVPVKFTLR